MQATTKHKTPPKPKTKSRKTQTKHEPATSSSPSTSPLSTSSSIPAPPSLPPPEESAVALDRLSHHSCLAKWPVPFNSKRKPKKPHYSPYFDVGGFDFRFLFYPKGDVLAPPGFLSLYIQIKEPRRSSKFDCFVSYKLSISNHEDVSKSLTRESYYRFGSRKKIIGWSDFGGLATSVFDPKSGFFKDGYVLVSGQISILDESASFSRDGKDDNALEHFMFALGCSSSVVLNGKFTWNINNFGSFMEMIKTQKLFSSVFQIGEVEVHFNVYKTKLNEVEYLSLCLEVDDYEAHKCSRCASLGRSSWCLFRISILNQRRGLDHMHRESFGRFNWVRSNGDNKTLGWTDYMKMSDFVESEKGFLVDGTVVFTVSFNALKETAVTLSAGLRNTSIIKKCDTYEGKYSWKIENFTRLKDILKKKKMKGVYARSRKFQVGNHDFRLVVYPRGQSQKPFHLSMFLEVLEPQNATTDWSCFASYQLSIKNQKMRENSILKESQTRFSKSTKESGWSEFVTLTSLFDKDSGFVAQDTVIFGAEVLIMKETFKMQDIPESSIELTDKNDGKKRWSIIWKVENFLSFKSILATKSIYSKYFLVDQLELRIGIRVSSETVYAHLDYDPSAVNDPDKNFWVSYRITVVNQIHPAKSFWKDSSLLCTKSCGNFDLQFMKLSDMLETNAGFVTGEMVTFACEIIDYSPWFDFSELEVIGDVTSAEHHESTCSESCKVMDEYNMDISKQIHATTCDHLNVEDLASLFLFVLKEELKEDLYKLAGILIALRIYLDNPAKLNIFLQQLTDSIGQRDVEPDNFPAKLAASIMEADFYCQKIDNALLDIMVECCQKLNRKSGEDPHVASSNPYLNTNEASSQTKLHWLTSFLSSLIKKSFFGIDYCVENCINTSGKAILGQGDSTSESYEEILGFIVNTLKALDDAGMQDPSEPSQGHQFVEKILVLVDEAPKHLLSDIVSLLPKFAYQVEHKFIAHALLDQIQIPGAESSMQLNVLDAMCQLEIGLDVWECALFQASQVVGDLNGDALGVAIYLLFEVASKCQHIPQAASVVHQRLQSLGAEVSPCVLDLLRKALNTFSDLAVTMLREIDSVFSPEHLTKAIRPLPTGENGLATKSLNAGDHHFSDIFMLLEMLTIPSIAMETTVAFEKGIENGYITYQLVEMVLEKYASLGFPVISSEKHQFGNAETAGKGCTGLLYPEEVYTFLFGIADRLLLSRNCQVHGFLKKFYAMLFRLFDDENYHKKMLRRLVEYAMSSADNCSETSLDVLVFLFHKEFKVSRLVLSMIRDDFQLSISDRSALQSKLCAIEDEYSHSKEEFQTELKKMRKEKLTLLERLHESEVATLRCKSEMKLEMDRSAQEKQELSEQLDALNRQLQHACSKKNDKLVKLSNEKKVYQDKVRDLEMQLSRLKNQTHQELKKVVQEKNVLAEREKTAEDERKKSDEKLRRCSSQISAQESINRLLSDEIQKLKQNIAQIKREKQDKEEEAAHCKTYSDELKMELNTSQKYIQSLQASLQEEMLQHAPLYGYGIENLSTEELETLSSIHEDGLRKIRAIQHSVTSDTDNNGLPFSL